VQNTGKILCLISLVCISQTPRAAEKLVFRGIVELQAVYNDAEKNWLDGGFSKTRYDTDAFPVRLGKAGLHVDYHVTDTLWLQTMSSFYLDEGLEAELIEAELSSTFTMRVGSLLTRRVLRQFHRRVDYSEYGGAPLLGVSGVTIVGHGRSSAKAVRNGVAMAYRFATEGVVERVEQDIAAANAGSRTA